MFIFSFAFPLSFSTHLAFLLPLCDFPNVGILSFGEVFLADWQLPLCQSELPSSTGRVHELPFLPLLLITNTSLLVFSGSDCADVFPSLSLIGKSHWRFKTAYELWLQKREKFSSERLRSGQSICTLTGEIRECLNVWWIWSALLHIRIPGHKQSPWHDWQWYNINVFVFVTCRKTLKQGWGFIALGDVNSLAWLIPIWFIYSWILFLYKNPLQAMPLLKNIAFPCWLNACNLWSPTVAAWMGGSSVHAFVLKWHHHKDILYWGSSWHLFTNRWPGFNIHYLEWMAPYS